MIIVPELKTVFILVPRTGSGTLYRELQRVYPKSMLLYRHMEADGVPQGYDRWKRIGFVRHPLARLQSLYAFLNDTAASAKCAARAQVVGKSFQEWLLTNDRVFIEPTQLKSGWRADLSHRDPAPENKRSQFSYLRPDLGTVVWKFEDLQWHMRDLGLSQSARHNLTAPEVRSERRETVSAEVETHLTQYCAWDLEQGCKYV